MQELHVFPYQWKEIATQKINGIIDNKQKVHCWCLDRQSNPLLIKFNYHASVYMKFPVKIGMTTINWHTNNYQKMLAVFEEMRKQFIHQVDGTIQRKDFYYYYKGEGYTRPVMKLDFLNTTHMREFVEAFKDGVMYGNQKLFMSFFEDDEDVISKFLVQAKITRSTWILLKVKPEHPNNKITDKPEYISSVKTIRKLEDVIGTDQVKQLVLNPTIVSFDIETYSHNEKCFPDRNDIRDKFFMVCLVWTRLGTGQKMDKSNSITIGIVYPDCLISKNCDRMIICEDEEDMIVKFCQTLKLLDPVIVTGYNISGFDFNYIYTRLSTYTKLDIPQCGMVYDGIDPTYDTIYKDSSWSSSASKRVNVKIFKMEGRIVFDLCHYTTRELNEISNKLDAVSKKYIGAGKDPVTPIFMFQTFGNLVKIRQQSIKDEQRYDRLLQDMRKVLHYCGVDCFRVIELIDYFGVWFQLQAMSNVNNTELEVIYSGGTGRRYNSLVYSRGKQRNYVMNKFDLPYTKSKGAFVFPVKVGLHDELIVFDFKSLYPTIIQAHNSGPDTLASKAPNKQDEHKYIKVEVSETEVHHFIKPEYKPGILPDIMKELLDARDQTRKEMRSIEDPVTRMIYDKRQLALKISANSIYGATGSSFAKYGCPPVAASVTALGRMYIQSVADCITEEFKGEVIFGDTDSFAVCTYPKNDPDLMFQEAQDICDRMNGTANKPGLFPPPMMMELEYVVKMLSLKKKNYIYAIYDSNPNSPTYGQLKTTPDGKIELHMKGAAPVRREVCEWVKQQFYEHCQYIFSTDSPNLIAAINMLMVQINRLLDGKIEPEDLVMINNMGSNYKSNTAKLYVFGERMAEKGTPIEVGEAIRYLIVDTHNKEDKLGHKMMTINDYYENLGLHEIDIKYYLETAMKRISKLVRIAYDPEYHIKWESPHTTKVYDLDRFTEYVSDNMTRIRHKDDILDKDARLQEIEQIIKLITSPGYVYASSKPVKVKVTNDKNNIEDLEVQDDTPTYVGVL